MCSPLMFFGYPKGACQPTERILTSRRNSSLKFARPQRGATTPRSNSASTKAPAWPKFGLSTPRQTPCLSIDDRLPARQPSTLPSNWPLVKHSPPHFWKISHSLSPNSSTANHSVANLAKSDQSHKSSKKYVWPFSRNRTLQVAPCLRGVRRIGRTGARPLAHRPVGSTNCRTVLPISVRLLIYRSCPSGPRVGSGEQNTFVTVSTFSVHELPTLQGPPECDAPRWQPLHPLSDPGTTLRTPATVSAQW
jgi:hypothetical protein